MTELAVKTEKVVQDQPGRVVLCRCGSVARTAQRTCRLCHRLAQRRYRKSMKVRSRETQLFCTTTLHNNPVTRSRFDRVFPSRRVMVLESRYHPHGEFQGWVLSFAPGDMVLVRHLTNPKIRVYAALSEIEPLP